MKLTNVIALLALASCSIQPAQASAAAAAAAVAAASAAATSTRHASTVREFRKTHACPATGKVQTTCPGYVVDHIIPLCAGGTDTVDNMMFQTTADSYRKDVQERAICRRLKACEVPK